MHVRRDRYEAKIWLDPVQIARNGGFSGIEISRISRIIELHEEMLRAKWDDYFSN